MKKIIFILFFTLKNSLVFSQQLYEAEYKGNIIKIDYKISGKSKLCLLDSLKVLPQLKEYCLKNKFYIDSIKSVGDGMEYIKGLQIYDIKNHKINYTQSIPNENYLFTQIELFIKEIFSNYKFKFSSNKKKIGIVVMYSSSSKEVSVQIVEVLNKKFLLIYKS